MTIATLFFCIDFAIVKAKYIEILSYLPENYEAMIGSLQEYLSDSQICDILSVTSGHSQKILNCLILRLKSKEDLLDFCDHLEKVQGAHASLKVIVEQLRKGIEVQLFEYNYHVLATYVHSYTYVIILGMYVHRQFNYAFCHRKLIYIAIQ